MEQHTTNQNTALLVMDVQGATVKMLKDDATFFSSVNKAIQTARNNKMPVIYVVIGFRKGYPEASVNNKSFMVLKNRMMSFDTEEGIRIPASVAPQPGDIIITKRRVSAFTTN